MKKVISILVIVFVVFSSFAQQKQYKIRTVGFYNLENLFDPINDPEKEDEKSPIMEMKSGREKVYKDKLDKLSDVYSSVRFR